MHSVILMYGIQYSDILLNVLAPLLCYNRYNIGSTSQSYKKFLEKTDHFSETKKIVYKNETV
jgi:hypothetical protein